jgi:nickel transport protein
MKSKRLRSGLTFLLAGMTLSLVMAGPGAFPARAHNVSVFAWVEGDTVHVESKFSGGRKPKGATIDVYDAAGDLLLQGTTDDNGLYSFRVPRKTEMRIVLNAGMGHRAEWTVPLAELESVQETEAAAPPAETMAASADPPVTPRTAPAEPRAVALTQGELQRAVELALDKKLKPLLTQAVESQLSGPSFKDVMGGIGYIFGLVGVGTYFHARRIRRNGE